MAAYAGVICRSRLQQQPLSHKGFGWHSPLQPRPQEAAARRSVPEWSAAGCRQSGTQDRFSATPDGQALMEPFPPEEPGLSRHSKRLRHGSEDQGGQGLTSLQKSVAEGAKSAMTFATLPLILRSGSLKASVTRGGSRLWQMTPPPCDWGQGL